MFKRMFPGYVRFMADPVPSEVPTVVPPVVPLVVPPTPWHGKLPEDIRTDPSLAQFKDETELIPMPINVARSFIATKALVGRDKIPMPKTEAEWNETYDRLGRPKTPELYTLAIPDSVVPKAKEILEKERPWFMKEAHAAGMSNAQAQALFSKYSVKMSTDLGSLDGQVDALLQKSELDLRTTYGNNFEGKMILMNRGLEAVGGKDLTALIKAFPQLAGHPVFIKSMVKLTEMMAEDLGLDKNTGGEVKSAVDLDSEIKTLQADAAYLDSRNPNHANVVSKVAKLMERKVGNTPVAAMDRHSFIV